MSQEEKALLTDRERLIVRLLAAGNSTRTTALRAGVKESTVWAYRRKEHIQRAISEAKDSSLREDETFAAYGSRAIDPLPDVVDMLKGLVRDPEIRAADRINAARTLMSAASDYQQRKVLEQKVRDLETILFDRPITPETTAPGHVDPDNVHSPEVVEPLQGE